MDERDDPEAGPRESQERELGAVGGQALERRVARLGVADPAPDTAGQGGDDLAEESILEDGTALASARRGASVSTRFRAARPSQIRSR